jgi:hypothetical protein
MKTIFFIIFILIGSFGLSAQRIIIHVTEIIEINGFDSTITDLLKNDSTEHLTREVNGIYDLDLTNNTFKFYINDQLNYEDEMTFNVSGDFINVYFLIDGYNTGMMINSNINREEVIWYSDDIYKEICQFTKFEIIKAL